LVVLFPQNGAVSGSRQWRVVAFRKIKWPTSGYFWVGSGELVHLAGQFA
jgi:hypothetical protein